MDLGLAMQKIIVGIRIGILDILYVPIFSQNKKLWIFRPKFVQKKDLGLETEKSNFGIRISIVETLCVPIFSKTGQLSLFWPKFAPKWI